MPEILGKKPFANFSWAGMVAAMFFRAAACLLLAVSAAMASETTRTPTLMTRETLVAAAVESATDGIGSGWCGRGMLSILKKTGLGAGLEGGNGQDWEKILQKAGWKPVLCSSPYRAPLGSVLVYLGDARVGKRPRGTPGGYHGHVEMVALGRAGGRLYVSDSPRAKPGGTVPDNFTGRAWMPPGRQLWKKQSIEEQVADVFEARRLQAQKQLGPKPTQVAALRSDTNAE